MGQTVPVTRAARSIDAGTGAVVVGTLAANLCSYLVHLPATRWLTAGEYSEFAVLLQATLLLGVPALAVQAVVAREVVRGIAIGDVYRSGIWLFGAVCGLSAAAVPVVMAVARTGFPATASALATAPLLVLIALAQGVIQGRRQFNTLGWLLVVVGALRAAPVVMALGLGAGPGGALAATSIGCGVAAVIAMATAGLRPERGPVDRETFAGVVRATQVQSVLIALTSVDLLLSRPVLGEHDAGVYALGTIATKVAFWLPQAIGVVIFPSLAAPGRSAAAFDRGLRLLMALGAVVVAGAAVGGPLVPVVFGPDYQPVAGWLWLFALTGCACAVLQLALLAAIAVDRTRLAAVAWIALVAEVVLVATLADSVLQLAALTCACCVTAAVVSVLLQRRALNG